MIALTHEQKRELPDWMMSAVTQIEQFVYGCSVELSSTSRFLLDVRDEVESPVYYVRVDICPIANDVPRVFLRLIHPGIVIGWSFVERRLWHCYYVPDYLSEFGADQSEAAIDALLQVLRKWSNGALAIIIERVGASPTMFRVTDGSRVIASCTRTSFSAWFRKLFRLPITRTYIVKRNTGASHF